MKPRSLPVVAMTKPSSLTLEFFHDVVCGWCFNLSPRLKALASEFNLDVRHRTFVLQDSGARMIEVFGSATEAKSTILGHWTACAAASDTPERFAIERMRAAPFDYPHGFVAAMACQVAQQIGGSDDHWRMFDALQRAHISEARNVADLDEVLQIARDVGFDAADFAKGMADESTLTALNADRALAQQLGVRSVPTVIIHETGERLRNSPMPELRAQLLDQLQALLAHPSGPANEVMS